VKKLETIEPKAIWQFFKDLAPKHAVFLSAAKSGISAVESVNLDPPPNPIAQNEVSRKDWQVFLSVLVALRSGRPVKIVPSPAGEDGEPSDLLTIYVGPKA
jgi:hypothetical protein